MKLTYLHSLTPDLFLQNRSFLFAFKKKLIAILFAFSFVNSYSQAVVDGSFEHCVLKATIVASADNIQTITLDPCGSPATLFGSGLAFFTNGGDGTTNNGCIYLSPPPSDGLRAFGFGIDVVLTVPLDANLVSGNCYTVTFDGQVISGQNAKSQPCSSNLNAAFELGVSNSSTSFGTSVGTSATITSGGGGGYTSLSILFMAPAGINNFIAFRLADQTDLTNILFIDNVSIAAVNCATPLTLVSFSGKRIDGNDVLSWITATEINTSHFEIEYSRDGTQFAQTGNVAAAGNSSLQKQYHFTNWNVSGDIFYRLRMVDIDGHFTYSNIIKITQPPPCSQGGFTLMNTAPSPFIDNFIVQYCAGSSKKVNVTLFDASGRLVIRKDVSISQGQGNFLLDGLAKLPAGLFIMQLKDEKGNMIAKKLVK